MYQNAWHAIVDKELPCERDFDHYPDSFTVTVVRGGEMVGCFPRYILSVGLWFFGEVGLLVSQLGPLPLHWPQRPSKE